MADKLRITITETFEVFDPQGYAEERDIPLEEVAEYVRQDLSYGTQYNFAAAHKVVAEYVRLVPESEA